MAVEGDGGAVGVADEARHHARKLALGALNQLDLRAKALEQGCEVLGPRPAVLVVRGASGDRADAHKGLEAAQEGGVHTPLRVLLDLHGETGLSGRVKPYNFGVTFGV